MWSNLLQARNSPVLGLLQCSLLPCLYALDFVFSSLKSEKDGNCFLQCIRCSLGHLPRYLQSFSVVQGGRVCSEGKPNFPLEGWCSGARLMWMSFKALCMVFVSFCAALLLSEYLRGFQCFIQWREMPVKAVSTNTGDSFLSHIYCQLRLVVSCTCSGGSAAPWNQRLSHLSSLRGSRGYPGKEIRELPGESRKDGPFCRCPTSLSSCRKGTWLIPL